VQYNKTIHETAN